VAEWFKAPVLKTGKCKTVSHCVETLFASLKGLRGHKRATRAKREARCYGEVAEWLKAPVLKTGNVARRSWVRIPPSPPVARTSVHRPDARQLHNVSDILVGEIATSTEG
jgi:hypothetical protein